MRTSAPGSNNRAARNGFTLVELLVVIAIVGLLSGAVMLALPDPRGSLVAEAERFAARAKAAQDRAILEAGTVAVRVTDTGYGFEQRVKAEWRPLERKPFAGQAWGAGTQALVPEGAATRLVFDPTGTIEPATLVLLRGDERVAITIRHDGTIDVAG